MSSLSLYLPPFASDYSGACSALFDLDCLIAINDASCCTANYVNYDEPRWSSTKKTTLCTSLRNSDAVFGIDEKVIAQIKEAAATIAPDFVVILGSPVPAIIGTDTKGLAMEVEAAACVPTIGIDTSGFSLYPAGVRAALLALIERFGPAPAIECGPRNARTDPPGDKAVNIVGMTPLDYGIGNFEALRALLETEGIEVNASLGMGSDLASVTHIDRAVCTVAVSFSGIALARELEARYKIPYFASAFTGSLETARALGCIKSLASKEKTVRSGERRCGTGAPRTKAADSEPSNRILIIGDQVIANSIRSALQTAGCPLRIEVASFFGLDPEFADEGDFEIADESALIEHLGQHGYRLVIGDPLLAHIPAIGANDFAPLAHPAVSSRLHRNDAPVYCNASFDGFIAETLGRLA